MAEQEYDTERPGLQRRFQAFVAYLFGRNELIGLASLMLLVISGYATWSGMNDFIVGVSTSPASQSRDLPGGFGLSVSNELLVIAIVVALTFLMWIALRESFRPNPQARWHERLITFLLYGFLALWSIGFGYGFWWSLIAGEEATRNSMAALQEDARDAGNAIAARLDAVRVQIDSVVSWSETQMAREETSGGSCGRPSGAGRGPLYNARRSVRDAIASLRDSVVDAWVTPVQGNLDQLRRSVTQLEGDTVAARQQAFEALASDIRGRARSIAVRSDELGKSTAAEMRALADQVSVAPGEAGFSCYDPTLADRLRQAANQASIPAAIQLREASFNEGPAGVANAVKRLWGNIGSGVGAVFAFVASGGVWPEGGDGEGITGRDLIALLATIGIDLGLFALTVLNPPSLILLERPSPAVIRQVRDAITTAVQRAPDGDVEWIRRHLIHHNDGAYLVIPNLYGCGSLTEEEFAELKRRHANIEAASVAELNEIESARGLAMNQLAGVLMDLGLLRWPKKDEMKELKLEETKPSDTDLAALRKQWVAAEEVHGGAVDKALAERIKAAPVTRNHGLFSKAERMLQLTGWTSHAMADMEIFRLTETRGLTPLLMVLNDPSFGDLQRRGQPAKGRSEGGDGGERAMRDVTPGQAGTGRPTGGLIEGS